MNAIHQLREDAKMTWIEEEHGWVAAPEDIVDALASEGYVECKRATTTSRRDLRPTGGLWQAVNKDTGAVASTIWVERPPRPRIVVFITIDGESIDLEQIGTAKTTATVAVSPQSYAPPADSGAAGRGAGKETRF